MKKDKKGFRKFSVTEGTGPFSEALFLDVPFVLDSLFRWTEFRFNRNGHLDLTDGNRWRLADGWKSPAFVLYALVSLFLVFGPTFDSLCGLFGATGIRSASTVTGWVGVLLICLLYVLQLAGILIRLLRRLRKNVDNFNHGSGGGMLVALSIGARGVLKGMLGVVPSLLLSVFRIEDILDLIPDLSQRTARLNERGHARFWTALVVLCAVMGALSTPLWLAVNALWDTDPSSTVCDRKNSGAVVWQLAVLATFVAGGVWIWSTKRLHTDFARLVTMSCLWLVGVTVLWAFAAPPAANEMQPGPYPHVYAIWIATLVSFALFAHWFAGRMFGNPYRVWFREYRDEKNKVVRVSWRRLFRKRFKSVELIDNDRSNPQLSTTRIIGAVVNGIGAQPLQFLLVPGFVALLGPPENLFGWTLLAALVSAVLLAYGSLAERWQQVVTSINRWYLVGLPLPLSILVIVLAILRLLDVQYVSTVLDASSLGTIVVIVAMFYIAAWFYEYWINRWPAQHLLAALASGAERRPPELPEDSPDLHKGSSEVCKGSIAYPYSGAVEPEGPERTPRKLSVHGTGRFCVQGWAARSNPALWEKPTHAAFTTYDLIGLFERLAPPGDSVAHRAISSLRRRLRLYFYTLNAVLAVVFGLLWYVHTRLAEHDRSEPVIVASLDTSPDAPSLSQRLAQRPEGRPAIIIAASGGGTRAALYTAYALQGLASLERTQDVVLISGVSGGGFASAVFAREWSNLQKVNDQTRKGWEALGRAATEPFIADVLDGVEEVRVFNSTPLGELLAESFLARTFGGENPRFGSLTGPALILNTSVSGHPAGESELLYGRAALSESSPGCATQSSLAGSRLIFTNLPVETVTDSSGESKALEQFPSGRGDLPDVRLGYTVVRDPQVSLASAAALNANFPPVFPNARVILKGGADYCAEKSYYVTDGGATENLGLVSALYALRAALQVWPDKKPLPPLHVVAIEASAVSYDYSQDRGVGAATGGSKERINGALTQSLLDDIKTDVRRLGGELYLHYLPLPVAFRSRGGFGTHWMYAREFRVTNPFIEKVPNRFTAPIRQWSWVENVPYYESIDQKDLGQLWSGLFRADAGFCSDDAMKPELGQMSDRALQVRAWVCGNVTVDDAGLRAELGKSVSKSSRLGILVQQPKKGDYQVEAWSCLVNQLGPVKRSTGPAACRVL